ncbi:alpha/beta hydrolase [Knoellia locipacati]|uniref:alpha/beta fold hydrolase n=1 Tax=Knoellia locipacati TaxID=882824 RepID=UPI00384BCC72
MAGHSFGGLYALTFAAQHPDEVAGMALIDSTSPDYGNPVGATMHPPSPGSYDPVGRVAALTSSLARLGPGRLYTMLASADLPRREGTGASHHHHASDLTQHHSALGGKPPTSRLLPT